MCFNHACARSLAVWNTSQQLHGKDVRSCEGRKIHAIATRTCSRGVAAPPHRSARSPGRLPSSASHTILKLFFHFEQPLRRYSVPHNKDTAYQSNNTTLHTTYSTMAPTQSTWLTRLAIAAVFCACLLTIIPFFQKPSPHAPPALSPRANAMSFFFATILTSEGILGRCLGTSSVCTCEERCCRSVPQRLVLHRLGGLHCLKSYPDMRSSRGSSGVLHPWTR